ncbi:hypothetical protein [Aquitalea palustris]|uniref:hypothetical protein n=1 Tax=Aquitalea palustris TaxID=2480983 RepID=UPI001CF061A9|nr:hypothetical protein [Aquitalea palustris]
MQNVNALGLNRVLPSILQMLGSAIYNLFWAAALATPVIVAVTLYIAPIHDIGSLQEWLHSDMFITLAICIFVLAWSVQGLAHTGKLLVAKAIKGNSSLAEGQAKGRSASGIADLVVSNGHRKTAKFDQLLGWDGSDDPLTLIEKLYFPDTQDQWQRAAALLVLAVLTHEHLELELDLLVADKTEYGGVYRLSEARFKSTLQDLPVEEFIDKIRHWQTPGATYVQKLPLAELVNIRAYVCQTLF